MTAGLLGMGLLVPAHAGAQEQQQVRPTGIDLQEFAYPFPVGRFALDSQGQALSMAYMDIRPAQPNGLEDWEAEGVPYRTVDQ